MIKPTIILAVIEEYQLHGLHATFNSQFLFQGLLHRRYVHESSGDHQCGFRCNGAITAHGFSFRHMLEKHWTVTTQYLSHLQNWWVPMVQLETKSSTKIPIKCCKPMNLLRLIYIRLNEPSNKVRKGKHLFSVSSTHNNLIQGNSLCPML
jgi:hypothetical protein